MMRHEQLAVEHEFLWICNDVAYEQLAVEHEFLNILTKFW